MKETECGIKKEMGIAFPSFLPWYVYSDENTHKEGEVLLTELVFIWISITNMN